MLKKYQELSSSLYKKVKAAVIQELSVSLAVAFVTDATINVYIVFLMTKMLFSTYLLITTYKLIVYTLYSKSMDFTCHTPTHHKSGLINCNTHNCPYIFSASKYFFIKHL